MLKSSLSEAKFMIFTLFAVLILVIIHGFHPQLAAHYNPINFLGIHTILELFAITISFSIFIYGWRKFNKTKSGKLLLLSHIFLIIGLLDLIHTLTFKGMPFFITESSVAKATWFWVIARTFEAIMIIILLLLPERKPTINLKKVLLTASILFFSVIVCVVFYFEKSLPLLMIEGEGTTFLKNTIEYFVSFLRFSAIVIALLFYDEEKNYDYLYMALAFTILFLSELIFTIYQSVYDIDNFIGHIYKAVGYVVIMRAFFFSIEKETLSEDHYHRKGFQLNDLIHEYPGILFTVKKTNNSFIHCFCDGELLSELDISSEKIVGKPISEITSSNSKMIGEKYLSTWESGINTTFRFHLKEKCLFVTLKPLFRENEVVELLGTVIDLSKIETGDARVHRYS